MGKLRKATTAYQLAGKLFDGQQVRIARELKKPGRLGIFKLERRMEKAESKHRDSYLEMVLAQRDHFAALCEHNDALLHAKELRIKQLLRRVRRYRRR